MRRPAFDLSKWYLDCVSPDGDAVIAYVADLQWRKLKVAYRSVIEIRNGCPPVISTSLKRSPCPALKGGTDDSARHVTWQSAALGVNATWSSAGLVPLHETIYDSSDGAIEWSCLLPSAAARVETSRGVICGHGYGEHLRITVVPWRLPISSLRWGRVATDDLAIVWIQYGGTHIVYLNGARVAAVAIDDEQITLEDGTRITADRGRVIRRGALGKTVLRAVPALKRLAPLRALAMDECKWLSRVTIARPGRPNQHAWAIHEVVTWPR